MNLIIKKNKGFDAVGNDDLQAITETLSQFIDTDLHKSMKAGKGHPIKAVGRMEKEVYNLIDWKKFVNRLINFLHISEKIRKSASEIYYKPDGEPFSIDEMNIINEFIRAELKISPRTIEAIAVRNYIVGNIIESIQRAGKQAETKRIFLASLPKTLKQAAIKYNLNEIQIRAIQFSINDAAQKITNITDTARRKVVDLTIQSQKEQWGASKLRQEFFNNITDTQANLNRDWNRAAITQANESINNGFIASCTPGEYVIGVSMPDACDWCKRNINGKRFKIRATPPPDYSNLKVGSEKYKEIAEIWEKELWVGKSNYGRSIALRKRLPDNKFIKREHHELAMPGVIGHPKCRCRFRKDR